MSINTSQFEEWLVRELCALKGYDRAHASELSELLVKMSPSDMQDYLRKLTKSDTAAEKDVDRFLSQAERRRQEHEQHQGPVEVVAYTKAIGKAALSAVGDEYGSAEFKKRKQRQAQEMAQKQKQKLESERVESELAKMRARTPCNCMATDHPLVGNCLKCGKVICAKEGLGPCLFCAYLQQHGSAKLDLALPQRTTAEDEQAAVDRKNTILSQDRSKRYTHVIDDQMDYYDADDRWMSPEERAAAKRERETRTRAEEDARRRVSITLDFEGVGVRAASREELVLQAQQAHAALADVTCGAKDQGSSSSSSSSSAPQARIFENPFLPVDAPVWIGTPSGKDAPRRNANQPTDLFPAISATKSLLRRVIPDEILT